MTQQEFQKKYGGKIINGWLVFNESGDVDLGNNQLTSLPENIKFENKGSVDLSDNRLTSLPENIKFKNEGWVDLSNNQLTSLPENIKFENKGGLYIFQNLNWKNIKWINKILGDKLTAEEVFAINNIEHRRVAYEYMDKKKMKELKDYKVLDEKIDDRGNVMKVLLFTIQNMSEPLKFYNCICPSSKREYFIQTEKDTCIEAKNASFGLKEVEWDNEW